MEYILKAYTTVIHSDVGCVGFVAQDYSVYKDLRDYSKQKLRSF